MLDLESLTAADFEPLKHSRFRVQPDSAQPFEVELVDVEEGAGAGRPRAPFSLVFRGGPSPPAPQQICHLEHDALGALDVFLVPLGPDEGGQRYEAVFT